MSDMLTFVIFFGDFGNGNYGIRAGRVQHLMGYFNQRRNLPFSTDFITLPPSIYRDQLRDLASSGDGFQAYATFAVKDWELRTQVTEAIPVLYPIDDLMWVFVGSNEGVGFNRGSRIHGTNLTLVSPSRNLQFRYDRQHLDFNLDSNLFWLESGKYEVVVNLLGVRWFVREDFDLTLEQVMSYAYGPIIDTISNISLNQHITNRGYALTARYRPSPKWEINAYVDRYCHDDSDCGGNLQSSVAIGPYDIPARWYVESRGIFARYKIDPTLSIAAQYTVGKGIEAHFANDPSKNNDNTGWSALTFMLVKTF
jgi:hypothetical protein